MKRMTMTFAVLAFLPAVAASQSAPPPPPPATPPAPQRPAAAPPAVLAPLPPLPPDVPMPVAPAAIAPLPPDWPLLLDVPDLPTPMALPELPELIAPIAPLPPMDLPEPPPIPDLPAPPGWGQVAVAPVPTPRVEIDPQAIEEAVRAAREQVGRMDIEAMRAEALDRAREARMDTVEMARAAREAALAQADAMRAWSSREMPPVVWAAEPFAFGFGGFGDQSSDASAYSSAMSALGSRQYENAVTRFDRVIAQKGDHADGALYWKAFSQFKLGRTSDALESIAALRRDHPQSRYINDAKILEADARRSAGQPVNPASMDDDELKILAIQGIQRADPAAAIPLLEGVLSSTNSLRVKQRALYVLALSDEAGAHDILMRYAKGGGNPDLQRVAIEYIASRRDKQTTSADLREIYNSTEDVAVRVAIINAYRSAGDKASIIAIAGNSNLPVVLRSQAVSNLSRLAAPQDVWALYQKEPDPDLRARMLSVLSSMKAVDQLTQAARTERDPEVRARAVRYLGSQDADQTGQTLVGLYSSDQDEGVRKAVISSLAQQNNAEGLVAIARKENSLDLTREIVSRLSSMAAKSKVAADYLMEIIKR